MKRNSNHFVIIYTECFADHTSRVYPVDSKGTFSSNNQIRSSSNFDNMYTY